MGRDATKRLSLVPGPADERERRSIEEPPRRPIAPIMRRLLPLLHHIWHPLDVDDTLAIQREDGVVRQLIRQPGVPIAVEDALLPLAVVTQRLHHFGDQAEQFTFGLCRVLASDDMFGMESEVVADDDAAAEGNADRGNACRASFVGRPWR